MIRFTSFLSFCGALLLATFFAGCFAGEKSTPSQPMATHFKIDGLTAWTTNDPKGPVSANRRSTTAILHLESGSKPLSLRVLVIPPYGREPGTSLLRIDEANVRVDPPARYRSRSFGIYEGIDSRCAKPHGFDLGNEDFNNTYRLTIPADSETEFRIGLNLVSGLRFATSDDTRTRFTIFDDTKPPDSESSLGSVVTPRIVQSGHSGFAIRLNEVKRKARTNQQLAVSGTVKPVPRIPLELRLSRAGSDAGWDDFSAMERLGAVEIEPSGNFSHTIRAPSENGSFLLWAVVDHKEGRTPDWSCPQLLRISKYLRSDELTVFDESDYELVDVKSVYEALKKTGYEFRFRSILGEKGNYLLAGRAGDGHGNEVDFAVTVASSFDGFPASAPIPAVPYIDHSGTSLGNVSVIQNAFIDLPGRSAAQNRSRSEIGARLENAVFDLTGMPYGP